MHLGRRIKRIMESKGLSVSEVASHLEKSRQAVYDIQEKVDINTSVLRSLAELFEVPLYSFFIEDRLIIDDQPDQFQEGTVSYLNKNEMNLMKAAMDEVIQAKNQTIQSQEKQIQLLEEKVSELKYLLNNGNSEPLKQTGA